MAGGKINVPTNIRVRDDGWILAEKAGVTE
jgi:hypothetical protein